MHSCASETGDTPLTGLSIITQILNIMTPLVHRLIVCLFTLNLNELRCFAAGSSGKIVTGREFQKLILLYGNERFR